MFSKHRRINGIRVSGRTARCWQREMLTSPAVKSHVVRRLLLYAILLLLAVAFAVTFSLKYAQQNAPVPLLTKGHEVDWWFVFKFNSKAFPGCSGGAQRACLFGGEVQNYKAFGQQYVFASSEQPSLQEGSNCAGDTTADPIGATFDQIFSASLHYVVWKRPVIR